MKEEISFGKKGVEALTTKREIIPRILESTPEEKKFETERVVDIRDITRGRNKIFMVELTDGERAVFKPKKGERAGERYGIEAGTYFKRERASFIVDKTLQLNLVPTTVVRNLGSGYGEGSLQKFIPDTMTGWQFNAVNYPKLGVEYAKMEILDYIIYNTDRHRENYLMKNYRLYAIDNSLTFNGKILIIQDFYEKIGTSIPSDIFDSIKILSENPEIMEMFKDKLKELLPEGEVDACIKRIDHIKKKIDSNGGNVPYGITDFPSFLENKK